MEVPAQAVRTLMELGVGAAGSGLYKQAMDIFTGIEAVRPSSEGPMVGYALICIGQKQYDEAIKALLEGALQKNPGSLEAKMILGTALKLAGRNGECDRLVKELEATGDATAKRYATALSS